MELLSLPNRSWLHEAWHYKTTVLGGLLAIASLSLAHYAGFLANIPPQIMAVAGMSLANGVIATFLFYAFFCAVSARVLTSVWQLLVLPWLAVSDRLGGGFRRRLDWSRQRHFVRSHSQTIKWEGLVWLLVQILIFLLLMLGVYVKFTVTWIAGAGLCTSILLIILSMLVRAGFFLQPKPTTFIRKIKARRVRYGRAASGAFVTASAALVIAAFFLGSMRASLLQSQEPHMIVTKEFTGMASVIASSDGALLLFQKKDAEFRYIYSSPEFTASMETKPVFPPIGTRK